MDQQIQSGLIPDYKLIYMDILNKKYPHKKEECLKLLNKKKWSVMDILELNDKIFETNSKEIPSENQKYKSYKKSDIFRILEYQKRYRLSNIQVANHFKLSRNTITKWRRLFQV